MTAMVAGISKAAVEREAAMMEASSNFIWARKLRALRAALDKAEAERDRLREAAIALRDDMQERSRAGMDVIHGEQYRIVNAGAGVWMDFCAALKGETP